MFATRITRLLGIRYPILIGAMHHITTAEMVSAAAEAGCIGFIPAASFPDIDRLEKEIRKAKDLTDGPIGLNISMLPNADAGDRINDIVSLGIDQRVAAFESAGRSPDGVIERIKGSGIPLIHKVPQVRYAQRVERLGVDAVTILGFEGGGFVGTAEIGSLVLINKAVRSLTIPVIAGGGIADGRGLVAALALGAEGVLMGSRFLASKEAPVPDILKQWLIGATENDTMVLFKSLGSPVRSVKNDSALEVARMEGKGLSMPEILSFAADKMWPTAAHTISMDRFLFSIGQSVGLIDDIKTIGEIVDDIMHEAHEAVRRIDSIMRGQ